MESFEMVDADTPVTRGDLFEAIRQLKEQEREASIELVNAIVPALLEAKKLEDDTPESIMEFVWRGLSKFGIQTMIIIVMMVIALQTLPQWVGSSIETQKSVSNAIENQTVLMTHMLKVLERTVP